MSKDNDPADICVMNELIISSGETLDTAMQLIGRAKIATTDKERDKLLDRALSAMKVVDASLQFIHANYVSEEHDKFHEAQAAKHT